RAAARPAPSSGRLHGRADVADRHVRAHDAGTAVLVGYLRLDLDAVLSRVERVDERRVLLRDVAAAHLPRARDLLVVRVQLLVQDQEPFDLRAVQGLVLGEARVHALDLAADQLVDLRLLRQIAVARIGDVAPLGPAADRRQVDVDERGHAGPRLTDADRLAHVRGELQLVLD